MKTETAEEKQTQTEGVDHSYVELAKQHGGYGGFKKGSAEDGAEPLPDPKSFPREILNE